MWGGKLTAPRLDGEDPEFISVDAEPYRKRA
jgi:bis(5'-nucleosyl)-tetraphosphatase (symmetrical)